MSFFAVCDIVLPVYGQLDYTKACVESLFTHTDVPFRLIIVNDASRDSGTAVYLRELQSREPQQVLVLTHEKNEGYVKSVNHGLDKTSAKFVVVMNNDTLVYPGWLSEMIAAAEQDPSIGIVNPQWDPPKGFWGSRDDYFRRCVLPRKGMLVEMDWARGFCYLTKRCVIDRIGGLDLDFSPAYFDDWDYSLRAMKEGYRCVQASGAFVFHFKNVTYGVHDEQARTNALLHEKAPLFYSRWGRPLKLLIVDESLQDEMRERIRLLLRGQNKIVFVAAHPTGMAHTNLHEVIVFPFLVKVAAWLLLMDDVRHSASKRFHAVLGGEDFLSALKKAPALLRGYPAVLFTGERASEAEEWVAKKKFSGA